MARRLRPAAARSARQAHATPSSCTSSCTRAARTLEGPEPRVEGAPLDPVNAVRPRRAVVARPHGARPPPAGRAHDAQLARPLGDLERQGRRRQADDAPAAHAAPLRARQLPHARARHGARRRDADLARPRGLERRGAQRELRARVLRAVHARRQQRLHGEGHPRGRARPDRLHVRLRHEALRLRPQAPRRRHEAHPRPARPLRAARRRRPRAREPAPRARTCASKLWGYFSPRPCPPRLLRAARHAPTRSAGYEIAPGARADPHRRRALRRSRGARHDQAAGRLRGRDAAPDRHVHARPTTGSGCSTRWASGRSTRPT